MSQHPSTDPASHPNAFVTLIVVVLMTPIVLGLAFCLYVWIVLSGGVDDAFRWDRPMEGDPEVVAAREAAVARQEVGADAQVVTPVAGALGAQAAWVGSKLAVPPCEVGEHHWKIDDDFDLACQTSVMHLVAVPDRADFRAESERLDAALLAEGWKWFAHGYEDEGIGTMAATLDDYWEMNGPPMDLVPPDEQFASGPQTYSMDDLPGVAYRRERDGRTQSLSVQWVERRGDAFWVGSPQESATFRTQEGQVPTAADLVRTIPASGYAVTVTLTESYFRE